MDKVYLVMYNNGEAYEDNQEYPKGIFKTEKDAEKYIFNQGYTIKENSFLHKKFPEEYGKYVYALPCHGGDYSYMYIMTFDLR